MPKTGLLPSFSLLRQKNTCQMDKNTTFAKNIKLTTT